MRQLQHSATMTSGAHKNEQKERDERTLRLVELTDRNLRIAGAGYLSSSGAELSPGSRNTTPTSPEALLNRTQRFADAENK